jgi:3-phenylpropionate/cinnamic acid dioxygenase small subunit
VSGTPDPGIILALRDLVYRYALALDGRDADALLAVFSPDAVVRVFRPDTTHPASETRGHEQIGMMVPAMTARYTKTMHAVSNPTCAVDGNVATGSAYCVAHHLIADDPLPRTFVVHLRYDDEFRREEGDDWRIVHRDIRFLWTAEGPPPLAWETAVERGRLG